MQLDIHDDMNSFLLFHEEVDPHGGFEQHVSLPEFDVSGRGIRGLRGAGPGSRFLPGPAPNGIRLVIIVIRLRKHSSPLYGVLVV